MFYWKNKMAKPLARLIRGKKQFFILGVKEGASLQILQTIKKEGIIVLLPSRFSCVQLCDPIDGSPPGSPVPGILQAGTLEWVATSFSNAWNWNVKVKSLSSVQLLATPWTAAYQAPPSMGFSRQKYWGGLPLPSLGIIVNNCQ